MKYLKFPFQENLTIEIQNGASRQQIKCELASSTVEIFQSLNYRKKEDFVIPLVLKFGSPVLQTLSWQSFDFPIEQICVDYKEGVVKKVTIVRQIDKGNFIQGYSELSLVILAPIGFSKINKVIEDKTLIRQVTF